MTLLQHPETGFEVQELLDKLFDSSFRPEFPFPRPAFAMPYDIFEKDGKYFVEFLAPGYEAKNISVEVTGSTVTVAGSFEQPQKKDVKFFRRQIPRGSFMRAITLPQDIDPNEVEASMHNGVLTLMLTPVKPIVPRTIAIKAK